MSKTRSILEAVFDDAPLPEACQACRADLAAYVDAELDARAASSLFPTVAKHLASCTDCLQEYEELSNLLSLERRKLLQKPPASPAFDFGYLPSKDSTPAPRPWRLDDLGRLIVAFSTDLLRSLQGPALQPAYLKSAAGPTFELELAEDLDDLHVTIQAEPQAQQPDQVDLVVSVDIPSRGGWPNLAGSTVTLRRSPEELVDEQDTDPFGNVLFEDVSAQDLPSLVLTITPLPSVRPHPPG